MTHKEESKVLFERPSRQRKRAQPPTEQQWLLKMKQHDRCFEARFNIDEAALVRHLELENAVLRHLLKNKEQQLRGSESLLHTAEKIITDLKQENDVFKRKFDAKEKEVKWVRRELKKAEASVVKLKEEVLECSASRAVIGKELSKVKNMCQKVQTELAWVRLRNLVDKVQARLQGLKEDSTHGALVSRYAALEWRKSLNGKDRFNNKERMKIALSFFQASKGGAGPAGAAFDLLNSPAGHLVTDNLNKLRSGGDDVAHGPLCLDDIMGAIEAIDLTAEQVRGVKILADFMGLY